MCDHDAQALAFVEGLTSLRGRRRAIARLASAAVLMAGCGVVTFGAVKAFSLAFA